MQLWWQQFLLIFPRTSVTFCTKTSLISHGGSTIPHSGIFPPRQSHHCLVEVGAYGAGPNKPRIRRKSGSADAKRHFSGKMCRRRALDNSSGEATGCRAKSPAFQAKNKSNFVGNFFTGILLKISTTGYQTLRCFIAALLTSGVRGRLVHVGETFHISVYELQKNAFSGRALPRPAGEL